MTFWIAFKVWLWNRRRKQRVTVAASSGGVSFRNAFCVVCAGYGCPACSHGALQ